MLTQIHTLTLPSFYFGRGENRGQIYLASFVVFDEETQRSKTGVCLIKIYHGSDDIWILYPDKLGALPDMNKNLFKSRRWQKKEKEIVW